MKRIFLSLAAIAFVAAGSMSVTSCGSDDSTTPPVVNDDNTPGADDNTPGTDDNTPPAAQGINTIAIDGDEVADVTHSELVVEYRVYNANTADEFEAPSIYIIDDVAYNRYSQYALNFIDNNGTQELGDYSLIGYLVENSSIQFSSNGQGGYTISDFGSLLSPTAIDNTELRSVGGRIGGSSLTQGITWDDVGTNYLISYTSFDAQSQSTEELHYEGTTAFESSFSILGEVVSTKFDGPVVMYSNVPSGQKPSSTNVSLNEILEFNKEYEELLRADGAVTVDKATARYNLKK